MFWFLCHHIVSFIIIALKKACFELTHVSPLWSGLAPLYIAFSLK